MDGQVQTYVFRGKTFEQRPLVLAQWRQLQAELDGLEIEGGDDTAKELIAVLYSCGRLDRVLAILLAEPGVLPRDKNLAILADELQNLMTPDDIAKVVIDFFDFNPANSVLSAMAGVIMALTNCLQEAANQVTIPTGSSIAASSSPEEILQKSSKSSGASPRKKPSPGSGTKSRSC